MFPSSELEAIAAEYGSYFPLLVLRGQPVSGIELKTTEGEELHIKVSTSGWYTTTSLHPYESFEALMNAKSPGFRNSFAGDLFSRLQRLAENRSS